MLLFIVLSVYLIMCLHPKIVNNDLLDRPIVYNNYCTFNDNCDYVSVDNKLLIDDTNLTIMKLNIRGLVGKLDQLKALLNDSFKNKLPDILLLCETWQSKNSPHITMPGYNKFKHRQTHKKGGRVCIYVKDHILCRDCPDLHLPDVAFEHCIVEIKLKEKKILIGSLYRVPNSNQQQFLKDYKEFVSKLKTTNCEIVLGMDHNLDFLKSHIHENTLLFHQLQS